MNAVNLNENEKQEILTKLKQISGRIKGLIEMVENQRLPEDILIQIAASYESLRLVAKAMIKQHLQNNVTGLIAQNKEKREQAYTEVMNIIAKYSR